MKVIITGGKNTGKSTFLYELCQNCQCSGVICLPVFENGVKIGSDAINLRNGKKKIFARVKNKANFEGIETNEYIISREGMKHAIEAIEEGIGENLLVIDEIGHIEMKNDGYYEVIKKVMQQENMIMVVRKSILNDFLKKFPENYFILEMNGIA